MSEKDPVPSPVPDEAPQAAAVIPPAAPEAEAPAADAEQGAARVIELDVQVLGEEEARRARRARVAAARERTPAEHAESAKSDGRTRQDSLLLMVPVKAGHYAALEKLLGDVANPPAGEDLEINPIIPFAKLRTVHFARILLHAASPSRNAPIPEYEGKPLAHGPAIPAKLLFSTDFDGTLEEHLDELLRVAGPGLDQVFGHCEGWPGHADRSRAHGFFLRHRVPTTTFYTGTMHRSVDQIHREADLRRRIDDFLDAELARGTLPADPVRIHRRVRDFVFKEEPELAWARQEPGGFPRLLLPPALLARLPLVAGAALLAVLAVVAVLLGLVVGMGTAVKIVLGVVAVLLVAGVAGYVYLRRLETTDPVIVRDSVKEHTARLVETEDRIVQNEMSSVIYIKEPLWFRRLVLWGVLKFVNFSAKYLSNQGTLAGIPSIHFARWVIVDDGRRLVFFSNFDGSWDNYLGDFVDKSATGLTGVWSNCVGFPRTKNLVQEGATDEQMFKAYSRDSQVPTQVWYSAYRWLSVSNINDNTKIRLGLYRDLDAAEAEAWLRRFGAGEKSAQPRPKPAAKKPAPKIEVEDVQGLVARSYAKLAHACYVPVRFPADAAGARAWVDGVRGRVTRASRSTADVVAEGWALNVAFTRAGLEALGLSDEAIETFSREFYEGMATDHRQRALGDTGEAAPEHWRWGRPDGEALHAMLFLFAGGADRLASLLAEEKERGAARGVALGEPLGSVMLKDDKEHFGFHDGIAQPRLAGLKEEDASGPAVPAGEVVLGYPNAYGKLPASPAVAESELSKALLQCAPIDPFDTAAPPRRDLGKNGTYVVFRTLEQDVKAFWRFVDHCAGGDAAARKRLAAKMVGRWPNGSPLVKDDQTEPPFDPKTANSFLYADDLQGDRCPLGSHIRRTNPRDGMQPNPEQSMLVADRHRLLRRGRAYGPPLAESFDPADILAAPEGGERGLHFICFNTDIVRQFEFVQNTWVNSMKFDGLYADPDPLIAPHVDPATAEHKERVSNFTMQGCPVRHRVKELPRFVTMRGGAYLFMPGLKALEYLAKM
ncbi:MAG TPA: hypothetical protein VF746_30780 [Longimicrobium sp.]|jgi:Dyp-type peroxidase family